MRGFLFPSWLQSPRPEQAATVAITARRIPMDTDRMHQSTTDSTGMTSINYNDQIAYTIEQAVRAASIGRSTLYADIQAGLLPTKKWGRRTLILRADLERWLDMRLTDAPRRVAGNPEIAFALNCLELLVRSARSGVAPDIAEIETAERALALNGVDGFDDVPSVSSEFKNDEAIAGIVRAGLAMLKPPAESATA